MECDGINARYVFVSMNNINVVELKVPDIAKNKAKKIAILNATHKYKSGNFQLNSVEGGVARIYTFDEKWIEKFQGKKVDMIPEIYLVPYKKNTVSVMAVRDGFVIRDSEDSGFRIESKATVKEYLKNKTFNLYNIDSKKVNANWKKEKFIDLAKSVGVV
jgi:hypothetical protein